MRVYEGEVVCLNFEVNVIVKFPYQRIASIAFHAKGDIFAVASGHKMFLWQMLIPVNVLMTAELPLISLPVFFVPSFAIDGLTSMQVKPSASMRFQVDANEVWRHYNSKILLVVNTVICGVPVYIPNSLDLAEIGHHQFLPERDPSGWDLGATFFARWLVGQTQAGVPSVLPLNDDGSSREPSAQYINFSILASHLSAQNMTMLGSISLPGISGRSSLQYHFSNSHFSVSDSVEGAALVNAPSDWVDSQPIISRIQSKITTSLAAVATAELPCAVKLRVWPHDVENPFAPLNAERCCLL
ncbi:hypothetical protein SO802_023107 [Lithocarpus litseifolius]|uniref:Uncharacterized protein n=1 Tax=Lithocarpus litseifolius TaxID=425828 RepID=A0AAW2C8G1_9ROSI